MQSRPDAARACSSVNKTPHEARHRQKTLVAVLHAQPQRPQPEEIAEPMLPGGGRCPLRKIFSQKDVESRYRMLQINVAGNQGGDQSARRNPIKGLLPSQKCKIGLCRIVRHTPAW